MVLTPESVERALGALAIEAAERVLVDAAIAGHGRLDDVVGRLGGLSKGAETLALLRLVSLGDSMVVDPLEVADQADVGSGEFTLGWWPIRGRLQEPARQWVELLEGRFPRARERSP